MIHILKQDNDNAQAESNDSFSQPQSLDDGEEEAVPVIEFKDVEESEPVVDSDVEEDAMTKVTYTNMSSLKADANADQVDDEILDKEEVN